MKPRRKVRPGNRPHTPEESARLDAIQSCVACLLNDQRGGYLPTGMPVERHHLLSGGIRIGHLATIGLCQHHHRGQCHHGRNSSEMAALYGPSLAKGSRPFHAHYGTDAELLALQNELLAGP